MTGSQFFIRPVNWHAQRETLSEIRRAVFIEEQNVPVELEWDGHDETSYHVLALTGEELPIGTGRLLLEGRIGRMAVLKDYRGMGVGKAILALLLEIARKEGLGTVILHAQTHALDFYARFGFVPYGRVFNEAGIAHRAMRVKLDSTEKRHPRDRS